MTAGEMGRRGEDLAARYLERRGWRILARRFRVRGGEIDLIAEDAGQIVFVEVKTRRAGALDDGRGAVDGRKRRRLVRAAEVFLARHRAGDRHCRFDVLTVCCRGTRHRVSHFPGAFDQA
ncbi:MAG: YraN family protein [Acidobacteriota bacterium]